MSMFNIEYKRLRLLFYKIAIFMFIVFAAIYSGTLFMLSATKEMWPDVFLHPSPNAIIALYPFTAALIALVIPSRGAKAGWKNIDLSMPIRRGDYAREGLAYIYKLYSLIMAPALLGLVVYFFISSGPRAYSMFFIPFIFGTIYSLFVLGVLTPSLAMGFSRGSFGWWALILLGIFLVTPVLLFLPSFMLAFGVPLSYAVFFMPLGPIAAILGYFNTISYFNNKPDWV